LETIDRQRLARNILAHDFENHRDRDTGMLLANSSDLDRNGWPDFWEPLRMVGFPEYLVADISIVPDRSPFLAGNYRDDDNHVLHIAFDGSPVGIMTSVPIPVNPELSYEISLRERDLNLAGAVIRAGLEWIHQDDQVTEYLRRDEIPDFRHGQIDWPVAARRLVVNDIPAKANAARIFITLAADQDQVSISHHGDIWFDDIRVRSLPKVSVIPTAPPTAGGGMAVGDVTSFDIEYQGLIDNIPDPENPGFFKGKRYTRSFNLTDIFDRPLPGLDSNRSIINIDAQSRGRERLNIPASKYGVYYMNLKVYDADNQVVTDITRALSLIRPVQLTNTLENGLGKPTFGLVLGAPPENLLTHPGLLRQFLASSRVRQVKMSPWTDNFDPASQNNTYFNLLVDEIKKLRSSGIRVIGVVSPPKDYFNSNNLAVTLEDRGDAFNTLLAEAGRKFGIFVDCWQWGEDTDDSLRRLIGSDILGRSTQIMDEYSGGSSMVLNVNLESGNDFRISPYFRIMNAFNSNQSPPRAVWRAGARFFPWLYSMFYVARGATYPPLELNALAEAPPSDAVEANSRREREKSVWLSLPSPEVTPLKPDSFRERTQLEQIMIRSVYAAVLGPDSIFPGSLFDPSHGLLRFDTSDPSPKITTIARPAFLTLPVLGEMLEESRYLGPIDLLAPFEAHVFRRGNTDRAVIIIWHNDVAGTKNLSRREIANGPPLVMTDWAGNSQPLPPVIPVSRVPIFITGMSASMALTRMSVRVTPELPIRSMSRRQNQALEVVNHMITQAPIRFQIRLAAREIDGGMENGWALNPEDVRVNLSPVNPDFTPVRIRYNASPDPNSPIQTAGPGFADKSGVKMAQLNMSINTSPPADIILYPRFALKSDLDIDIERLVRNDDPQFVTLQMRIRWFPEARERRRGEIHLMPFYLRKGEMREFSALPVTVRALPPDQRTSPTTHYETVELRIPRSPPRQTWVGINEEGGSNFYLADVTAFMTR
jgi:hypothetical protein